jgi:hypothetical protein
MAVVLLTLAGALAWQRPAARGDTITIEVAARTRIGRVRPIWDEINLWKLGSMFGAARPDPARWWGAGWLRRRAPWVRYARLLAALGGSYAPQIAPWCDWAVASPEHPDTGTLECGHDGVPGPVAREELARIANGALVVDYAPFRTAIERVLRSGVVPHLNVSAAPAAFTGAVVDFAHYHWNAAPVQDFAAWSTFVRGAFQAVADLHPNRWRASIVNEANCLTLVGWEGNVQHVGYDGTPADYARTWVTTARAIREVAPGIVLHAGNYVTSATFPGEDNLRTYLRFLGEALAADDDLHWRDLSATSLSLYETRDTDVYDLVRVRIGRLERAVREAGLAPLPIKVDELDVHPTIAGAFMAATRQNIDRSAWTASWHAEAIRQLLNSGRVASAAPWLQRTFDLPHDFAPYPKARTYELLGILAGQLRPTRDRDGTTARRTPRRHGLPRLAVDGERPPAAVDPDAPGSAISSVGALATRTPNGLRLLVVHHQSRPATDGSAIRRQLARRVRLRARDLAPGAYRIRVATIGTLDTSWNGRTTPLKWRDAGCRQARSGIVEIAPPTTMEANTVALYDVQRRHRCPNPK